MNNAVKTNGAPLQKIPGFFKDKIGVTLTKLAQLGFDSAVNCDSPKGFTGSKKVYRIVQEKLKDLPTSLPNGNPKKAEDFDFKQEMQIKEEEMQEEDMTNLKQQYKTSATSEAGREPQKKFPNEGIKGADPLEIQKKRIFIRSRL